ncbi:MAG: macrolide transport system ATP-binding/permease protein [Solirubrobacteraceae bacterium]|nr:macrolide transport system ATP-binding/permease protein [Solirubrobacteraceae bacterium]
MTELRIDGVERIYAEDPPVVALAGVGLRIEQGEFVAVLGPSGSGKSSLLNLIALIDRPTRGGYLIDGRDTAALNERSRSEIRSRTFGFVFQSFHLIPRRSALENVELGLLYRNVERGRRRMLALQALERVGLEHRSAQAAAKLSGGERQRVAIARAIIGDAPVVVADEPTGNLDSSTSRAIVDQLERLHAAGTTVVLVTHDEDVAAAAQRRVDLRDGRIVSDVRVPARAAPHTAAVVAEYARSSPPAPRASAPRATSPAPVRTRPTQRGVVETPPVPVSGGAGMSHASRLRARDLVLEAIRAIQGRPGRAAALIATIAVAVALVVTTAGLSQTASSQVSERFDAKRNREVTVTLPSATGDVTGSVPGPRQLGGVERRVAGLAGVDAAGVIGSYEQRSIGSIDSTPVAPLPLMGVSAGALRTVGASVAWAPGHLHRLGAREALVGAVAARQLELAPLESDPSVSIDGVPFAVAGVIRNLGRTPELLSAVVIAHEDAATFGPSTHLEVVIKTAAGAAPQVARQAPLAIDPVAPTRLGVDAPADPTTLRNEIQADLAATLIALTIVAALASVIGVGNAMLMSVVERIGELGLRRAIGARPVHILGQITVEALLLGVAGGAAGFLAGSLGILTVTVAKHWQPVLDLRLVPIALAGGAIVGVAGGLAAAMRASRIQPSDALRR